MEWRLAGLMECLQGKLHNTGSITREGEEVERRRERRGRGWGGRGGGREEERKRRGGEEEERRRETISIIWITHKAKCHTL